LLLNWLIKLSWWKLRSDRRSWGLLGFSW